MSYRFMRVIVFFDLPVQTASERKAYRQFRRHLLSNGFMMMQQSVYSKLALNTTTVNTVVRNLRKNKPTRGNIQLLVITERQFNRIEYLLGENTSNLLDDDRRLVIL